MSMTAADTATRRLDRRVRKTRRALGDALLSLLTEKRYEAVTVQDVIDRADGFSCDRAHSMLRHIAV